MQPPRHALGLTVPGKPCEVGLIFLQKTTKEKNVKVSQEQFLFLLLASTSLPAAIKQLGDISTQIPP